VEDDKEDEELEFDVPEDSTIGETKKLLYMTYYDRGLPPAQHLLLVLQGTVLPNEYPVDSYLSFGGAVHVRVLVCDGSERNILNIQTPLLYREKNLNPELTIPIEALRNLFRAKTGDWYHLSEKYNKRDRKLIQLRIDEKKEKFDTYNFYSLMQKRFGN